MIFGSALSYVAGTSVVPPVPPCWSSVTVYCLGNHLAYNVVTSLFTVSLSLTLVPEAVYHPSNVYPVLVVEGKEP